MAQAISNKVLVRTAKYCWMICDYSISGSTMSYTLKFFFEGGDAQLDNAWIKVGNTTVWSNTGRVHNYDPSQDMRGNYQLTIHSGQANISGTQSVSFGITKYQNVALSGSFSITGGTQPSGGSIYNLTTTWNSITGTLSVLNWGGLNPDGLQFKILKQPYVAGVPARQNTVFNNYGPATITVTDWTEQFNDPDWQIKGCGDYHTGLLAWNSAGQLRVQGPMVYTPPAPSILSYTENGGYSDKDYTVNFAGVGANNNTDYDSTQLTRTVRYKIGNGDWVTVVNAEQWAVSANTSFNITVPAGKSATIEGWQIYRGLMSEVATVTIVNSNAPIDFYGSVNNLSKKIIKFYGPVNDQSKKVVKIYGSVNGVSREFYEDV